MDKFNVSHNLLSVVGGRVECTHMYPSRQSSYQMSVFGHLVVGGGQLLKLKNFLNIIS